MRKWIGGICIFLGVVCLLSAVGFLVYNLWENKNAEEIYQVFLEDVQCIIQEPQPEILAPDETEEMPAEMATKGFCETSFCLSRPYFLEFFSSRASKANAIAKLCEMYGITPDEVVVFGDAPNDLPMIEFAGLGVAMGNADECVKAVADMTTVTNDEDGVAVVIEEILKGEI